MDAWFASGQAIDLVIAVLLIEVVVLRSVLRRPELLPWPTFAAGLSLLIAWRLSQAGWTSTWVGLALAAAGLAHAVDLWRRRTLPRSPTTTVGVDLCSPLEKKGQP